MLGLTLCAIIVFNMILNHYLIFEVKQKTHIEYPFENVKVLKLHTGWCINTPSHYTDTVVLRTSVAREGKKTFRDFTVRPMVTLKQLRSLMAVIGET